MLQGDHTCSLFNLGFDDFLFALQPSQHSDYEDHVKPVSSPTEYSHAWHGRHRLPVGKYLVHILLTVAEKCPS